MIILNDINLKLLIVAGTKEFANYLELESRLGLYMYLATCIIHVKKQLMKI